jgi:hypothetical protein
MEIAGCFVGQMNAAWLVGKRGMVVIDSTARKHENSSRAAREKEVGLICLLIPL